ncbi:hypothetical protein KC207_10165 [Phycicoccus sp. BSK3Z-2]|uniref:Uncharacterized protein n=1 Tax=Phycicoccus avicenniae TaxID=2828860 RepID=A0A941D7R0_9MICO|nr:hypothetical protein [Phycicoccus avicenniae]MBR7743654.1 hypothetical protein [Phycicoccus avicenniae]
MRMAEEGTSMLLSGFLAFASFTFLALALWFLMRNMNARMRRMSYRQQRAHLGRDDLQARPGDTPADAGAPDEGRATGRAEAAPTDGRDGAPVEGRDGAAPGDEGGATPSRDRREDG